MLNAFTPQMATPLCARIRDGAGQPVEGLVSVLEPLKCPCREQAHAEAAALRVICAGCLLDARRTRVYQKAAGGSWPNLDLRLEGVD